MKDDGGVPFFRFLGFIPHEIIIALSVFTISASEPRLQVLAFRDTFATPAFLRARGGKKSILGMSVVDDRR